MNNKKPNTSCLWTHLQTETIENRILHNFQLCYPSGLVEPESLILEPYKRKSWSHLHYYSLNTKVLFLSQIRVNHGSFASVIIESF